MHRATFALSTLLTCSLLLVAATPAAAAPAERLERQPGARQAQADLEAAVAGALGRRGGTAKSVAAFERQSLGDGVAWYRFELQVGPGEHDRVRLHRVVRELAPWLPKPAADAALLVHGDSWGFAPTFLSSVAADTVDDGQAIAPFLARHDVDVWGLDLRWVLVPGDTVDPSFVASWNLGTNADDIGSALRVARLTRLLTGSGFGKLFLLGWSRGGQSAYAYLDAESQQPAFARQVRGFIPADIYIKTDDEALRQRACDEHAELLAAFESGYTVADSALLATIGQAALDAPEDPAPIFPLFTNRELALDIGIYPRSDAFAPLWHPVGGVYDQDFFPIGLLYSDERHYFSHLAAASTFQPVQNFLEGEGLVCDQVDLPYDDHLSAITVPVLYVGAGGGFGTFGEYSTTLLGSTDVSSLVVSQQPPALRDLDWGHTDIFLAEDAETEVWQPILDWMRAR